MLSKYLLDLEIFMSVCNVQITILGCDAVYSRVIDVSKECVIHISSGQEVKATSFFQLSVPLPDYTAANQEDSSIHSH
jgi:hypothetical protein